MLGGALELVDERDTRGARPFLERQQRCLAFVRSMALVTRIAREHEAVDHERRPTWSEELREPHVPRCSITRGLLKDIVVSDCSAEGKPAPRYSHSLHRLPQISFLLE